MRLVRFVLLLALVAMVSMTAVAQDSSKKKLIEIYRIAPGQHVAFMKAIASYDEANRLAGLPPRELYVHSDGANWDFLLIQPAEVPEEKSKALAEAWKKLGLPSGAKFFSEFRVFVAEHTDTFAEGPISAKEWLSRLDQK